MCESVTAEEYVTLNLPDTITVESIPADVAHESAHICYAASYALEGHQLQIQRSLVVDYPSRKCAPGLRAEVVALRASFAQTSRVRWCLVQNENTSSHCTQWNLN